MPRDESTDVISIEPTRSDQLIDLAKNSRRGRFSLRYLFMSTLVASMVFALLRAMGVLERWEDYYWLFMGVSFLFAPMICLFLAAWLWPGPRGLFILATTGSLVIGLAFVWSMIMAKLPAREIVPTLIGGLVVWSLQLATLASVHFSVFRDRVPRRTFPDELPASDEKEPTSRSDDPIPPTL